MVHRISYCRNNTSAQVSNPDKHIFVCFIEKGGEKAVYDRAVGKVGELIT